VAVGNTRAFAAERLKGAVTWFCYDGDGAHTDSQAAMPDQYWTFRRDRASVDASGTVRALAPGDVTVVALDEHLNKSKKWGNWSVTARLNVWTKSCTVLCDA